MAKTIYQDLNLNGNKLQNIANGENPNDVVNKSQLDSNLATAQAYVDGKIEGLGEYVSPLDPASGLPTAGSGADSAIDKGDWYRISTNGTILGVQVHVGDRLQAAVSNPDTTTNDATNTDWFILANPSIGDIRYDVSSLSLVANTPQDIVHNLGYKHVQTNFADAAGNQVDVNILFKDTNTVTVTANTNVTVDGVISL